MGHNYWACAPELGLLNKEEPLLSIRSESLHTAMK